MAGITTIRKHYDKLEPPERASMLLAAYNRGDRGEELALRDTAPFTLHGARYYQLLDAIDRVGMAHMALMHVTACRFLMAFIQVGRKIGEIPDSPEADPMERAAEHARTLLELDAGFRVFCEGIGYDPDQVTAAQPGGEIVVTEDGPEPMNPPLPAILLTAALFALDNQLDQAHVEEARAGYNRQYSGML